jgi:hypothetical protein
MESYKVGEVIKLTRVSRKYGCRKGTIKGTVKLYSNDELRYPNTNSKEIQLSLDSEFFDQPVVYQGLIVDCVDILGEFKETITCTEGMIRKSQ